MNNRLIRLFSAAAAITLLAAGCESKKNTNGAQTHFSVFITTSNETPSDDNKILKKIEDELGYTFDFNQLVNNLDQKVGVMIAGNDYADILSCDDNSFVQAGALVPLDDYITEEKTPNLYNHLKGKWNELCYQEDGHLYVIPPYGLYHGEQTESVYQGPAFWVQKVVLEEAGYPEIHTLDEYFSLLEDYREKHPKIDGIDTIGFEVLTADNYEWVLTTAPSYLNGNPNNGDVVVDKHSYHAEIYADSDFAKRYYKKLNEEYAKGIIDPEAFTQGKDQYLSKISSGAVLGMFDQHWVFQPAEEYMASCGMYEHQYVPVTITFDESIEPWYRTEPVINVSQGYGISVKCKDPEAAVQMFEKLMDEKWQKILQWGIDGEDYFVDDNNRFYRTPEQRIEQNDAIWTKKNKLKAFLGDLPKIQGSYSDGNGASPGEQPEEFEASLSEYDRNFLKKYKKNNWMDFLNEPPENPVYYPAWNIDLIDGSEADYAHQKLTDLSVKYLPKLIMSDTSEFEPLWQLYCDEIRTLNTDAYEARINEQIAWRVEHWTTE